MSDKFFAAAAIAVTFIVVIFAVGTAGCAKIYATFGTTPEEVHKIAVQKVSDYAEAAIAKKIEASEDLTDAGKERLKAEVSELKADILAKIEEIRAKTKTGGAAEK